MLPSEEEDFLDTRLVTQLNGGGYHRNTLNTGLNGQHNSDSNVTGVGLNIGQLLAGDH